MAILNRIRGNPEALSTFVVVILAVSIALIIALILFNFNTKMVVGAFTGALLGAAASALLTLFIRFLAEPDLRGVSRVFLEAVRQEVHGTGYYCRNLRFTLELKEEERQLILTYSSTVVPIVEGIRMHRPQAEAPKGLEHLGPVKYSHNGFQKPEDTRIPLTGNTQERCEIVYKIKDDCQSTIKDEHRWRCPMEGFELIVKLPLGYEVEAFALRGDHREALNEVTAHTYGERIFVQREALFSHQGFQWSIEKN